MKLSTLSAGTARFLLPLCLCATAAADVIYVAASGNGQYTTIPAAIAAAQDGDVLLVRSGTYSAFTLDNRELWIMADVGAVVKVTGTVLVQNVAANKACLLAGLQITGFNSNATGQPALRIENNAGHVRLQGCATKGGNGGYSSSGYPGGVGAVVMNSARVAFSGSSSTGGNGGGIALFVSPGGKGGDGVTTQGSIVAFYDCVLKGGVGGAADYVYQYDRAGDGGEGCRVYDFGILASGSHFQGGMGGGEATIPGNGGIGLRVDNGQAQLIGDTFAGGLGGVGYYGNHGQVGAPQAGAGVFNTFPGLARKISAQAIAAENGTLQFTLTGEPGDQFWLLHSALPNYLYAPGKAGVLLISPLALAATRPHATLPVSGIATVDVPVPDVGVGTPALFQYWQCWVISASGQVRLGSALHVAVLNCSDLLPDCNGNGSCDSCDLVLPTVIDCDKNGVPDSCEPDCNANGLVDACDISNGTSADTNQNGIPDECEPHTTWYVDASAATGGNGTQGTPYNDLAQAFAAASSADTVLVAPGFYQGSGNRDLNFAGRALIVRSTGSASDTIIDCQGLGRGFKLDTGVPPGARIEGLRIVNGIGSSPGDGGAIYVRNCSPLIRDCVFEACQGSLGGAVRLSSSNARIERCMFIANTTTNSGGAINNSSGEPRYLDCAFVGNHANTGGAITLNSGTTRIERCLFQGNSANGQGGALGGFGNIHFDQCLIVGNTAGTAGGGIIVSSGIVQLSSCTIVDNNAGTKGAALYFGSSSSTSRVIRNTVIWNNIASTGTAIELTHGPLDVAWSDLEGGQGSITVGAQASLSFGPGNIALDPDFVDRKGPDNNPLTLEDNDYRLGPFSPCLDAGDNASVAPDWFDLDADGNVTEPVPFDFDGNARFIEIPSAPNTGSGVPPLVDLGAWERP